MSAEGAEAVPVQFLAGKEIFIWNSSTMGRIMPAIGSAPS